LIRHSKPRVSSTTWDSRDDVKAAAYEWADRIQVNLLQVRIRSMRRKWASISTIGRLTLSADLLKIPKELGELVIIHELVHLLVPNHGKVFKSFMLAYLPDWEEKERLLQEYSKSSTNRLHNKQ
jgi:predicted metal-dependent hydrolase